MGNLVRYRLSSLKSSSLNERVLALGQGLSSSNVKSLVYAGFIGWHHLNAWHCLHIEQSELWTLELGEWARREGLLGHKVRGRI